LRTPLAARAELATAAAPRSVLKVGAATSAKKMAVRARGAAPRCMLASADSLRSACAPRPQGSIAHVTREGAPPTLLPLGAACINQAVKGIAIARRRVHSRTRSHAHARL
jgi:stage V sporulation protein SpoVS